MKAWLCFLVVLALLAASRDAGADASPPGDVRTVLTVADLMANAYVGDDPVHNAHFMPAGPHGPAVRSFEGTLVIPEFAFHVRRAGASAELTDLLPGWNRFPAIDLSFFTHDGDLVPVRRGIIRSPSGNSAHNIIVSPGRVWSEPGDEGFTRATFPFALVNATPNAAYNGIATFLFDDQQVSALRFQITQESAFSVMNDLWGQSPVTYRRHAIASRASLAQDYADERARQLPMRHWQDLEAIAEAGAASGIRHRREPLQTITVAGLIVDDTIYAYPCAARYGDYPFCREMRHGVYSVTKSMGAALTLLRLAQKHGPEVFDLKITDHVEIAIKHDGWNEITFADALNMATGVGYRTRERKPIPSDEAGEDNPTLSEWLALPSKAEKLSNAFAVGEDFPWGPGEVVRYNSMHTFILSAAMDGFLKTKEGHDADLWDMVQREVLAPIGAQHVPMMRTVELDGTRGLPIMGYGLYLTIDDAAKIARLFHAGGRYDGVQLLHAGKLAEALYKTEIRGLPTGGDGGDHDYHLSFWLRPFNDDKGCETWIPTMLGYGGNIVMVLPNGTTAFRFADSHDYNGTDLAKAAHDVRPLCPD